MLVGTSIGGYTLVRLLGAGGMGSVYLANDPAIGQQVAVKVIRTDVDDYTDTISAGAALERFRQEARAVAHLDHLHILPLNRYGEEETPHGLRAYMIMQYRPEGSLWDWLRRRAEHATSLTSASLSEFPADLPTRWPLNLEEAAEYIQQAASALQYSHDQGIVHRDIKPANFLLRINTHERTVHLLLSDFGLAKVFTASSATSTILGTPIYMAPEQFEGAARPESDQYALAVMAYYLLAGRTPFEGDALQLMRQHLSADVPSITAFNPLIPPYMNGILGRALAKVPEKRFSSIAAFADAFTRVAAPQQAASGPSLFSAPSEAPHGFHTTDYAAPTRMDEYVQPPTPGQGGWSSSNPAEVQRAQNPMILPGLAGPSRPVNPAQGGGAYNQPYNMAASAPAGYPPFTPAGGPQAGMYSPPPSTPSPAYSPSATPYPAPARGGYNGGGSPYASAQSGSAFAPPAAPQSGPTFAPQRAPAYPAPEQNRYSEPVSRRSALGWIIGGTIATVAVGGGIGAYFYVKNRQPANSLQVLKGHTDALTSLNWHSDGVRLATGSLDQSVRVWSSTDGSSQQTLSATASVRSVIWSPDGTQLAAGEDAQGLDLWKGDGSPLKYVTQTAWTSSIRALAWRGQNSMLYLGTYGEGLHSIDTATYARYGTNSADIRVLGLSLSPDAHYLAVALESGTVYLADLLNGWKAAHTFPHDYGISYAVAWSPDSRYLAVGYESNVVIVYHATSYKVLYTLKHSAPVYGLAWSPAANSSLLATGAGDNSVNIWDLGVETPTQTIYTGHSDAVVAISWGSTYLASASTDRTAIIWQPSV